MILSSFFDFFKHYVFESEIYVFVSCFGLHIFLDSHTGIIYMASMIFLKERSSFFLIRNKDTAQPKIALSFTQQDKYLCRDTCPIPKSIVEPVEVPPLHRTLFLVNLYVNRYTIA